MGAMTKEQAARILDPETSREALLAYSADCMTRRAAVDEACTVAAKVLRETAWISVKDRLPDDDQMVLVIASGKPQQNLTLDRAIEIASYYTADSWVLEAWPEWETPNVTHWMPLPEPPKEDA